MKIRRVATVVLMKRQEVTLGVKVPASKATPPEQHNRQPAAPAKFSGQRNRPGERGFW
jgi:hypothetical protein